MFRCLNCDKKFDEPIEIETTYENYYGVSSMFGNLTPLTLHVCPYCESDEFGECDEDDEEEDD